MQIEQLDKERAKFYKDYLQQEISKHSEIKKHQSSYLNRKKNIDKNQLIKLLNDHDQERLQIRRNNALNMKQHNKGMDLLRKKSVSMSNDLFHTQRKHNSFTDDIQNMDEMRITKIKHELADQTVQNSQQDQMRRYYKEHEKNIERSSDLAHLRRNKQMQEESVRNYQQIKRRHEQNMNIYSMHQNLIEENQHIKQNLQNFTNTERDVINPLYRNEADERRKVNRYNQEIIKRQMDEFRKRKSLEVEGIKSKDGSDLQKSIFRNILHHDSYDRKEYADFLKAQIGIENEKKSHEKSAIKEKTEIKGVFGGQYDPQRKYQIQIIEKGLGFKNYDVGKYRYKNSYQNDQHLSSHHQPSSHPDRLPSQYYQNKLNSKIQQHQQIKSTEPTRQPQNSNPQNKQITSYQTNHSYYKPPESTRQPIKHSDDYNKRYFKSYDLVSGRSKLYDYGA